MIKKYDGLLIYMFLKIIDWNSLPYSLILSKK